MCDTLIMDKTIMEKVAEIGQNSNRYRSNMKSAGNHGRASKRTRATAGSIDPSNLQNPSGTLTNRISM